MVEKGAVYIHPRAANSLDKLAKAMYKKGYLGSSENADRYVNRILQHIMKHVHSFPAPKAPPYFVKYGKNLYYISYRSNKRTTWYAFFSKTADCYLVYHITNNHREGKYIR